MRIIIDADACPVLDLAIREALKRELECIAVFDNTHVIQREGVRSIIVDKGADCADLKIANIVSRGDIVITQDYGLAAMCLGKGAAALNQNGLIFTDKNIENLLFTRYASKKARMAGKRTKGPPKRTAEDDKAFMTAFLKLLEETV